MGPDYADGNIVTFARNGGYNIKSQRQAFDLSDSPVPTA